MITQILPGVTVEVVAGERDAASSVEGVVTTFLELDWGDTITVIRPGMDTLASLGYQMTDPKMKLINEAMNYADQLILYRTNSGEKAEGELATGLTATAKYSGTRGNDISVTVEAADSNWTIKTYLGTQEVDSQTVATADKFQANDFISLTGSGTLAAKTVKLSGGTNGTEGEVSAYFAEIEKHDYNIMFYTGTDTETIAAIKGFVKEQRANGVMIQAVVSGDAANDKAIYNNTVGGVTQGYELTAAEACSTMAGILAKQGIKGSATYYDVIGWEDVSPRLTKAQQEAKTQNGEILFVYMYGGVKILYDINSLTTYTDENPEDFHKGLVVRTLDKYASDLQRLLNTRAIGKIRNSIPGRNQIKGYIVDMTKNDYLDPGYVEGFTADDVIVEEGDARDSVTVTVGIRIADTIDKIYVKVIAR